jgi:WD40 repeat protein
MYLRRILGLVLIVLASYSLFAQTEGYCPSSLEPRLVVGEQGRITPGSSNNIRLSPSASADRIGQIPGEAVFLVVAGPVCAEDLTWWQVDYNGVVGWTVESSGKEYWVEPLVTANPAAPTTMPTPEPAPTVVCTGALPSRLTVGSGGRVMDGVGGNVRDQSAAGGARLSQLDSGSLFTVLSGPVCADGFAWWQVESDNLTGWIAEGTAEEYWLEPLVITSANASRVREVSHLGRGTAEAVLWSPDGRTIAILGSLGVWLYDAENLSNEPRLFDAEGRWYPLPTDTHRPGLDRRVAFSSDGALLVLGYCVQRNTNHDNSIQYARRRRDCTQGILDVWDVATAQRISRYSNDGGGIISVSFARDDDVVAFGSEDNVLRLWELNTNSVLSEINYNGDILRVTLDADASRAVVLAYNPDAGSNVVFVWEFSDSLEQLDEISLESDAGSVGSLIFSPDLSHAAASHGESQGIGLPVAHNVKVYDLTGRTDDLTIRLSADEPPVSSYVFSPDSNQLAIGTQDGTLRVWQVAEDEEALTIQQAHERAVISTAFNPDGSRLATVGHDQLIHIWDAGSGDRLATISGYAQPLQTISFSPDGTSLATLSQGEYPRAYVVSLWDVNNGVRRWQQDYDLSNSDGEGMAFHPDGSQLVVTRRNEDGLLAFDVQTGEPITLSVEDLPSSTVYHVAYTPDGSYLVMSYTGPSIGVWNMVTGQLVYELTQDDSDIMGYWSLVISPDGILFATNSSPSLEQGRVSVWALPSGVSVHDLPTETGNVITVVFSPDSRLIAAGGIVGVVQLWEAATGRTLMVWDVSSFDTGTSRALIGEGIITDLAFSPDGTLLAIAVRYVDRSDRPPYDIHDIRLWDVEQGKEVAKLSGHTDEILDLNFSPDGTRLASASHDGTVRIWGIR